MEALLIDFVLEQWEGKNVLHMFSDTQDFNRDLFDMTLTTHTNTKKKSKPFKFNIDVGKKKDSWHKTVRIEDEWSHVWGTLRLHVFAETLRSHVARHSNSTQMGLSCWFNSGQQRLFITFNSWGSCKSLNILSIRNKSTSFK